MFTSALKSFTSNITSNYTISTTPSSISGPWKIYDAKKKSTGKAVSVFVFERKSLDPHVGSFGGRSSSTSVKKLHDEVISRLKRESSLLARLRHPSILELAEPIEDTRSGGFMFATELVTSSLAGLLQEKDDQERAGGVAGRPSRFVVEDADGQKRRRELEIDELEIQKGMLQIAQGLEFLHESAHLVHGNLTPEAIYVNVKSDWKIAGLGFSGSPDESNSQSPQIGLSEVLYHESRLPKSVQLDLDYTSPDFVIDTNVSSSADMFSLGLLVLALYNSPHISPLKSNSNVSTYKKIFSSSSTTPSSGNNFLCSRPLPKDLLSTVLPRLLARRPAQRMNAREFQQSKFFDNILVSSIRFLDSLPAKTLNEKSQFLRGLPRILSQFPKSVLDKKVLPALLEETKDRDLLSLILSNAFKIIEILPSGRRAFTDRIIPQLREIFLTTNAAKVNTAERDAAKEAGLVVLLENMDLVGKSCSGKEFKDNILPIVQLGLESPTHSVVDKSLGCLPTILAILDFSTIKNDVFPVVASVFSKTSSLGIKIRALQAFATLCGGSVVDGAPDFDLGLDSARGNAKSSKPGNTSVLDKYTIQEKIIPLLKGIKTKEPAVMMAALSVFQQIGNIVDIEFLAMDILPILWAFSLGPLLNLEQFQGFMGLIKASSTKIEQHQTRKLRELSSNSEKESYASKSGDLMSMGLSNGMNSSEDVGENDFERLVLGRKSDGATDILSDRSKPATQRAQSALSEPAFFSWSTPSNPNKEASRAVTPDHSLSGFATLQPTTSSQPTVSNQWTKTASASNSMQRLNPFVPLQPSSNSATGFAPPPQVAWAMGPSPPSDQQPSAFSIAPPPQISSASSPGFSLSSPPSQGHATSAAPKYGAGLGNGGGSSSRPGPVQKKSGLDQYESLI